MRVAILQSNYIPWKGYFDLINMVDQFVFYDDMQYTKRDWRNRNKVKSPQGSQWLTIPVEVKGKFTQRIRDTQIADTEWNRKHWEAIKRYYSKARYFDDYKVALEELYATSNERFLCDVNYKFIRAICHILGITTKLRFSSEFELLDGQTEKLLGICAACRATEYISGPAAKEYFDESLARTQGINVTWMDYSGYKEYSQLYPPFEHHVSALDLILNEGPNATKYMKSWNETDPKRLNLV